MAEVDYDRLFETIADVEAAVVNHRSAVTERLYQLEGRNAILERQNRELRGEVDRLRAEKAKGQRQS